MFRSGNANNIAKRESSESLKALLRRGTQESERGEKKNEIILVKNILAPTWVYHLPYALLLFLVSHSQTVTECFMLGGLPIYVTTIFFIQNELTLVDYQCMSRLYLLIQYKYKKNELTPVWDICWAMYVVSFT